MNSILFLLGSARIAGNSELLAIEAAKSLSLNVNQHWIRLSDYPLGAFHDVRHKDERTYEMPKGNALTLLDATLAADAILFACPVYWYSLPAPAKLYLDHWSHWMRIPKLNFRAKMKGKEMYLVAAMAGPDSSDSEPLIRSLQLTANYLDMEWGGVILAHANAAGDVLSKPETLIAAGKLFESG